MSNEQPTPYSNSASPKSQESARSAAGTLSDDGAGSAGASGKGAALLVVAAIIGGVLGGALGHIGHDRIPYVGRIPMPKLSPKAEQESIDKYASWDFSPDVMVEKVLWEQTRASRLAAWSLGIAGLLVGGVMGAAAAATRKSSVQIVIGLLLGAVLGAGGGVAAGYVGVQVKDQIRQPFKRLPPDKGGLSARQVKEMYQSMAMHAAVWGVMALAASVAFGLAGNPRSLSLQKTIAAVVGGILAAITYNVVAGVAFPRDEAEIPFPAGFLNACLFMALGAVLIALLYSKAGDHSKSPATTSRAAA